MVSSSSLRSSCSRLLGLNGIDSPEKDGAWARCTSEGSTEHSSVHSSGRRRQRQVRTGGSGRSPRVPPRRSPCRPRVNRPSTHSVQRATRCISMTRRGGRSCGMGTANCPRQRPSLVEYHSRERRHVPIWRHHLAGLDDSNGCGLHGLARQVSDANGGPALSSAPRRPGKIRIAFGVKVLVLAGSGSPIPELPQKLLARLVGIRIDLATE